MNTNWSYVPFSQIFNWCKKSIIGSNDGKPSGKYKLFIASATKIKYFDEYLEEGESLIFGTGGNPCIYYVNEKFAYTNHTETAKKKIDNVNLKFYYYYFQKNKFEQLSTTFVGGGIKNSSKKKIGALMVPLPDIDEQNNIVAKIEELFSELDKAVDTLQNIKKQFLKYRRSVIDYYLKYDFGSKDSLTLTTIGEVCHCFDNKRKPVKKDERSIDTGKYPYYGANGMTGKIDNYLFDEELVLVCEDETFVGRVKPFSYIINGKSWVNNHAHVLKGKSNVIDNHYLNYLLSYYPFLPLVTGTTGRKKLTKSALMSAPIKICNIEKQNLIVQEIESRFSVCDNIEKTIDTALLQSEALRQTILKQAFEGELIK